MTVGRFTDLLWNRLADVDDFGWRIITSPHGVELRIWRGDEAKRASYRWSTRQLHAHDEAVLIGAAVETVMDLRRRVGCPA